jgi:hypothetical protein
MKPGTFIGVLLFFALSIPLVSSAGEVNITIGVPAPLTFAGPPSRGCPEWGRLRLYGAGYVGPLLLQRLLVQVRQRPLVQVPCL